MNQVTRTSVLIAAVALMAVCHSTVWGECVVPNLKGERVSVARQVARIANLKLVTGVFYISPENWRDDLQADVIYLQSPQPDTRVADRSVLACWTFRQAAAEQKVVTMPDLKTLTYKESLAKILDLELDSIKTSDAEQKGAEQDESVIVEQYPRAGQKVFVGTSVYLTTKNRPAIRADGP